MGGRHTDDWAGIREHAPFGLIGAAQCLLGRATDSIVNTAVIL